MADIDLSNYKDLYVKSAREYIEAMHASMVLMQVDNSNPEATEILFRSAHSLKTQSTIMGFKNTASLNEFIEHTMRNVKEGKQEYNEKVAGEVQTAVEKIEKSIDSIETLNKELALQEAPVN